MAVQADEKLFFTFVAGLNSEAGWFTAPPNTWRTGDNVVPDLDGVLRKRRAVDFEESRVLETVIGSTVANDKQWAYATGNWDAVGGDGDKNLFVVQIGPTLHFYDSVSGTVSGRKLTATVDLTPYHVSGNPNVVGTSPVRCTIAAGKLIVVSQDTYPILLTYVSDASITSSQITLKIRDFIGFDDGLEVSNTPSTLSKKHAYNLLNQGWTQSKFDQYKTYSTLYPSNAQSWIYAKDSDDNFKPELLDKQDFGTSPAAKGRFILDALNRDRATAGSPTLLPGDPALPTETEIYGPSCNAFFAGRAWYSGIKSETIGNWVLFSKVSVTTNRFGECFQEQDPTSEVLNDIVDSDGGVIPIQDCGEIVALVAASNGVLVFASNGVWKIAGTLSSGFSATSYEVTKLSSVGCVGPRSIVVTDGGIVYWSYNGIYTLEPAQGGALQVVNYSDTVIKTYYGNIPALGKKYAEGVYNTEEKTIVWLFTRDLIEDEGASYRWRKNEALVFDVRLKAFYTLTFNSLSTNSPYIVSPVVTKETGVVEQSFNVVEQDADQIITTGGDVVVADIGVVGGGTASLKFLTTQFTTALNFSFADLLTTADSPARFSDWYSVDQVGAPFSAYVETSYVPGPGGFHKQHTALYVTTFMERTETDIDVDGNPVNTSSALMRGKWNFTDDQVSGKWGNQQQVYRKRKSLLDGGDPAFNDGYPLVVAKSKIRGRGRALQIRFDSEAGLDMRLAGWAVQQIGNTHT